MMKFICIFAPKWLARSHFGVKIQKINETYKVPMVFDKKNSFWVIDLCFHIKKKKKKETYNGEKQEDEKTFFFHC